MKTEEEVREKILEIVDTMFVIPKDDINHGVMLTCLREQKKLLLWVLS